MYGNSGTRLVITDYSYLLKAGKLPRVGKRGKQGLNNGHGRKYVLLETTVLVKFKGLTILFH